MPAEQRGGAFRSGSGWGVRWRENGQRTSKSGFKSKSAALAYYRDTVRPRLLGGSSIDAGMTLSEFTELYIEAQSTKVAPNTLRVLRDRLKQANKRFGTIALRDLERMAPEIDAWRSTLSPGSRRDITQALRQALAQAVRFGAMLRNPAKDIGPNPAPKRKEIVPFTPAELNQLCTELGPWAPMIRFAAATGLRPSEYVALEHRHVRRDEGVILVERAYTLGYLNEHGKTANSRRRVPLSAAARRALADHTTTGIGLVFPGADGGYLNFEHWRYTVWGPAIDASGIGHGTCGTPSRPTLWPRHQPLRPVPLHGHQHRDDRQDLRAPRRRLRTGRAREARRVWPLIGH